MIKEHQGTYQQFCLIEGVALKQYSGDTGVDAISCVKQSYICMHLNERKLAEDQPSTLSISYWSETKSSG